MVDITNLANLFSQKTGVQSSMATMAINAVIGYMMQRGLGGIISGGGQSHPSSTGQQQPQKKKGLLDDVMGSLGV